MFKNARRGVHVAAAKRPEDWFEASFGFRESHEAVHRELSVSNDHLRSAVNGKSYRIGTFETPSLGELCERGERGRTGDVALGGDGLRLGALIGDVSELQAAAENRHATFQAASQFNCLEFVSPSCVPEDGVTGYVHDKTQGPACSVSCGPATVYRNYFVQIQQGKEPGQTKKCQIQNLADVCEALRLRTGMNCFTVRNGYTLVEDPAAFSRLRPALENWEYRDALGNTLRVGVHADVQVTSSKWGEVPVTDPKQIITQVFCSALSIAYARAPPEGWQPLAQIVLDAAYEATFLAAIENAERHSYAPGSNRLFLTLLGGGAFGNPIPWIINAIGKSCHKFRNEKLDVRIVEHSVLSAEVDLLVSMFE